MGMCIGRYILSPTDESRQKEYSRLAAVVRAKLYQVVLRINCPLRKRCLCLQDGSRTRHLMERSVNEVHGRECLRVLFQGTIPSGGETLERTVQVFAHSPVQNETGSANGRSWELCSILDVIL